MQGSDPFGLVLALGLIIACAMFGALVLWLFDQAKRLRGQWHELDRCLTCRKTLRYDQATGTYRRHRCRPLY